MKLGSLFDGSGGFPLAGVLNGITPVWAAEVEPYPIAVTRSRFPGMKHYGNVCDINGAEIEPVDIITAGSPCQDMSIAGLRAGIYEGKRSNLFFESIRIVKEMRAATNGKYPRFFVWENVPGAFSSDKGGAFQAVLQAVCSVADAGVSIPQPQCDDGSNKSVWRAAGSIVGNGYSVAWRTLDAQYWGVPQRRARIYLVADFDSERASEILFKPESLRGDMQPGDEAREKTTADALGCADGGDGCVTLFDAYQHHGWREGDSCGTLTTGQNNTIRGDTPLVIALQANGIDRADTAGCNGCGLRQGVEREVVLQEVTADAVGGVDGSSGNGGQLAATVISSYGTKWNGNAGAYNGENFVLHKQDVDGSVGAAGFKYGNSAQARSIGYEEEISPTLSGAPGGNEIPTVVALQGNGIDRADTAGCNGCGWRENESYTLNTIDRHAVCFDRATFNQGINAQYDFEVSQEGVVSTVVAKGPSGACYDARGNGDGETVPFEPKSALEENWDKANVKNALRAGASKSSHAVVQETYTMQRSDEYQECNVASTQSARQYKSATDLVVEKKRKYIIRRLTPTECARLQGFPDKWGHLAPYNPTDADFWENVRKTHAEINGKAYKPLKNIKGWYDKLHNDGAEYKMWGNGIALPCAEYVIRMIKEEVENG